MQNLPVAATRRLRSTAVIADCDDMGDRLSPPGPGSAEGDQLGAGTTSEVVQVNADEHAPVSGSHGSTHRVHPVFVRPGIGVGIDALTREVHQLNLARVELTC